MPGIKKASDCENSSPSGKSLLPSSNISSDLEISIHCNIDSLETEWRELENDANISIYQRFDWVTNCISTFELKSDFQSMVVAGRMNGKLIFVLPLAVQNGWLRKIHWIGGSHSNFNLPLISSAYGRYLGSDDIRLIFERIIKLLPENGYLELCCQPVAWAGHANPLLALNYQPSTNDAFAIDLSGGFDAVLDFGNGKRKRKKFRTQMRSADGRGGAQLVEATTKSEVLEILECFHNQKFDRLREQGLRDVFGAKNTKLFLRQLAINSLNMDEPVLNLFALKIDGKYRAICGGGVLGNHFSACFTSFSDDELAHISPGEMLLYMMIEKLVSDGFMSMDLGVGDERYKQSWCSQKIEMFDVILSSSKIASGWVWLMRTYLALKRQIRKNAVAWNFFKRMRINFTKLRQKSLPF